MMKKNKAKASLYSFLSIITLIMIIAAAWNMLNIAEGIYANMLKRKGGGSSRSLAQINTPEPRSPGVFEKIRNDFKVWHFRMNNAMEIKNNEESTAEMLKKYAQAQKIFFANNNHYVNNAADLILEVDNRHIIIDPELQTINFSCRSRIPINGYYFIYGTSSDERGQQFLLCAVPEAYGITGKNTLCVDARSDEVKKKDIQGEPQLNPLLIDATWERF